MPNLTIVVASTRPGSVGPTVAQWFVSRATDHGAFDVRRIDLSELNLPFLDEPEHPSSHQYARQHTRDWSAAVDAADAFVLVMPEYNQGFNAPLKNALDFLYDEWAYKAVGLVSYGMTSAGLRAAQMIKPVLTALRMVPTADAVSIPLRQRLRADGTLDADAIMDAAATALLDDLERLTAALIAVRTPTFSAAR